MMNSKNKCKWSIVGVVQREDAAQLHSLLARGDMLGADDLARGLMVAAELCYEECGQILLDAGALPDIHDASGITPLIAACKRNQAPMVKMLVKYGCNVNKMMFRIRATALHWAASLGHLECVKILLNAGAKTDVVTAHGRTPLMMACRSGHEEIVELLLQQAESTPQPSSTKSSVDHLASSSTESSDDKVTAQLVCDTDLEGATALHLACEEGATDCVRLLLKRGADINAKKKKVPTAIMLAAKKGHHSSLKLLLRQIPLDLNIRGQQMSALHWAAEGGHLECVKALLEYGSDPNVVTKDCRIGGLFIVNSHATPLMLACKGGYSMIAELLLNNGAKVDLMDAEGLTALLYAVKQDSGACVKTLAQFGADINGAKFSNDERGLSPLVLSVKKNRLCSLAELLRNGADTNVVTVMKDDHLTAFELALSLMHVDCCKMMLIAGHRVQILNKQIFEESLALLCSVDESLFESLCNVLWSTPSLKDICRWTIRSQMICNRTNELPLPSAIKDFISLKDLDEFL